MIVDKTGELTQKQPDIFKVSVVKDFVIFTEKHLCWSLFLIKSQA